MQFDRQDVLTFQQLITVPLASNYQNKQSLPLEAVHFSTSFGFLRGEAFIVTGSSLLHSMLKNKMTNLKMLKNNYGIV